MQKHQEPAPRSHAANADEEVVKKPAEPTKKELEAQDEVTAARAKVGETRIAPDSAV